MSKLVHIPVNWLDSLYFSLFLPLFLPLSLLSFFNLPRFSLAMKNDRSKLDSMNISSKEIVNVLMEEKKTSNKQRIEK